MHAVSSHQSQLSRSPDALSFKKPESDSHLFERVDAQNREGLLEHFGGEIAKD